MVSQYPYSLYQYVTTEAVQNGNGDYVAGSGNWELIKACRDEANTGGNVITLEDAIAYRYDSIIWLPKIRNEFDAGRYIRLLTGTQVEVRDENGNVRLQGKVRRVMVGHLSIRVWV